MADNYVYLKNLQGAVIKPVTDLSAINLTTGAGIGIQGNTIGVLNGYVAQEAYTALTDPADAAHQDSAYIAGGTMFTLIGGYTVTDSINTGAPNESAVPNEVAVANLVNTIETITGNTIHSVGEGLVVDGTQMRADFATTQEVLDGSAPRKVVCVQALDEAIRDHADTPDLGGVADLDADYLVGHYDVAPWGVIESIPMDATSWEIKPGHAYKLLNLSNPIELTASVCPADGFGTEAHIEIFNAGDGYIHFGQTIVIGADALTANAVNDCTVRFHGGIATLQVEDVISGIYDVTTSETSGEGSLDTAFNVGSRFVRIESGVVGSAVFETAVTSAIDAVVMDDQYVPITIGSFKTQGTNTAISINESTKVVTVTAGTFTLADYTIPSGSTVAVSGGALMIEKVIGDGGVIELGNTSVELPNGSTVRVQGCTVTGGSATNGGAFNGGADAVFTVVSSVIAGNSASNTGGGIRVSTRGKLFVSGSVVSGNTANLGDIYIYYGSADIQDSTIGTICANNAAITLTGVNHIHGGILRNSSDSVITVERGAVIDLTGNTAPTPIAPGLTGSSVIFAPGGATVYPSAGSSSAYMLGGIAVPQLGNTNEVNLKGNTVTASGGTIANATFTSGTLDMADVYIPQNATVSVGAGGVLSVKKVVGNSGTVDLGKTNVIVRSGGTAYASGVDFSNGSRYFGGFVSAHDGGSVSLSSCSVTRCSANYGGALYGVTGDARFRLVSCIISGNTAVNNGGAAALATGNTLDVMDSVISGNTANEGKDVLMGPSATMRVSGGCTIGAVTLAGGTVEIAGSNAIDRISSRNVSQFGSVVISSGAILNLTSSINPGGGITVLTGGCTVNGNVIPAGTYTSINSNGQAT